ncbi:MAG: hypothetical protein Q4P31_05300 [Andreesenia angusta]|nr:hypothetical protein [Andreesenia angusta]
MEKKPSKRRKNKSKNNLKYTDFKNEKKSLYIERKNILFAMIFLGLLILISLWRNAVISEIEYKNADLKNKKYRLEKKISDLNIDIEQTKDSDWLKTQAEQRINMRDAKKEEIVKISLKEKKKENKFISFFKKLIE